MSELKLDVTLEIKKNIYVSLMISNDNTSAFLIASTIQREKHTLVITKTYLYNFDPLKPHFYIGKLGFTGVYIIFLIFAQNIDCGYPLEPPR